MNMYLQLAKLALATGSTHMACALLRDALGKANVECPQARSMILRALNHARRIPDDTADRWSRHHA